MQKQKTIPKKFFSQNDIVEKTIDVENQVFYPLTLLFFKIVIYCKKSCAKNKAED